MWKAAGVILGTVPSSQPQTYILGEISKVKFSDLLEISDLPSSTSAQSFAELSLADKTCTALTLGTPGCTLAL